ncbi:lipoprotein-anchoring transpeptidase ErfK/SrfK [Novosphingobium chloroacetimidivorans]|uniref:Lipoprotein-anchoring transpeptidase ErfK/SrfK n=1 Tax=Novosphingobium chloroacetimidivorans TaxID=1428314 RepID=A0A7W7KBT4_9SPHN|nr:L,D-transpeptidase family protein [Novosphingobium chloroacetimidivorans]MBB4859922.1 lipoprotein-anchoring transpeptidase ErfK/SrfK [Novosphingobium chloroacetimidivorans]
MIGLSACNQVAPGGDNGKDGQQAAAPAAANQNADQYKGFVFTDAPEAGQPFQAPANMAIEVALDRLGFSSGVIDGKATRLDTAALKGFQLANNLPETGKLDDATKQALGAAAQLPATRMVTIPEEFARGPFKPDLPKETGKQAGFDHLSYRNLSEALAERFHTTPEMLAALNGGPGAKIGAGTAIRVPNVADADVTKLGKDERGWNQTLLTLGVSPEQPQADRVEVSKSAGTLRAYDASGKLLVQFPVTTGSKHDPLPLGDWKILGVSKNPDFHYNPKLFWDVSDSKKDALLKPGPNGPVGVVWLDLSKEHYGIHGTGEPASIGQSESHGCVRLTNWDAARLAQMVKAGTKVVFKA